MAGRDRPELRELLDAVRGDDVQFATMRRPGSPFATLDRRIAVVSPPELEQLTRCGDVRALDALVDLLRDRSRAWAAAVALAAMTGREAKEVEAFAMQPGQWWETLGEGAHDRWRAWLDETRDRLRWDPEQNLFVQAGPEA